MTAKPNSQISNTSSSAQAGINSILLSPPPQLHDAAEQARNLRQVLEDDKQRIGCFLGAGCPLGIYDSTGEKSMVLIPALDALTEIVGAGLKDYAKQSGATTSFIEAWDALRKECRECVEPKPCDQCSPCKYEKDPPPTVEHVLTELRTLTSRRGKTDILGISKEKLNDLDDAICSLVKDVMTKALPAHRCSYNRFASWIGGIHRLFPVEIFTPNYDLLFEQAFEQQSLPHFDGFVGTREPWFDLAAIEHDAIPSRWTRLWKLHGSINWERIEEKTDAGAVTRIVRVTREAQQRVMIYPSHLKYDQSRRMPYLAMLDRLRVFFRGDLVIKAGHIGIGDQDAPRLIICGYSFADDHFNEVLLDGLRGNLKAQCFALMFGDLAANKRVLEYAQSQPNLTVLARDGAVIGTRVGLYRVGTSGSGEHDPWLCEEDAAEGTENPKKHTRCRLGDFHYFGLFLEQLYGGARHNDHPSVQS